MMTTRVKTMVKMGKKRETNVAGQSLSDLRLLKIKAFQADDDDERGGA